MAYTFARRDQLSRQRGYQSYGHERAVKEEAEALALFDPQVTDRFLQVAKTFTAPRRRRQQMRLWIRGAKALVALDHELADEIASEVDPKTGQLILPEPIRLDRERPESVFWYH